MVHTEHGHDSGSGLKDRYRTKSVTTLSLFQSLSQDFLAVMAP